LYRTGTAPLCNAEEEPAHLEEGGGGGGRGGLKHVEVGKREGKEKEELSKCFSFTLQ